MRPRHLYIGVFCWMSLTGGRFLSPFLEHEMNATRIGTLLALQPIVMALSSSQMGKWADAAEIWAPGKGRCMVLVIGLVCGTVVFLLHALKPSWIGLAVLRVAYAIAVASIFPVLDGICLDYLGGNKQEYGGERLYGAYSWAAANLLLGVIADRFGFSFLYPAAVVALIFSLGIIVLYMKQGAIVAQADETDEEKPDEQMQQATKESGWTLFRQLIHSWIASAFLFCTFTLAIGQAVVEGLIFLYFETLQHSSFTFMGCTVVLTVALEIPIFQYAPRLLEKLGVSRLLWIAMGAFLVRVLGYTLVSNAWHALILEPLHGVTYACSSTSIVEFVSTRMPPGKEATGQGWAYWLRSLGSVVGLWGGGFIEDHINARFMYRYFAAGSVLLGALVLQLTACLNNDEHEHSKLPQQETSHVIELTPNEAGKDDD